MRAVITAGKYLKNVNTKEGKGMGWEWRNRRRVVQGRREHSEKDEAEGGEGQEDVASAWWSPRGQKPQS